MAWISFGALPCREKNLYDSSCLDVVEIARVPDMLPSSFPGRAKDLSAPRVRVLYGSENKQVHPYKALTDWFFSPFPQTCEKRPLDSSFVRLFVRIQQLDSHWTDFDEVLYLTFFSKIYWENSNLITI